LSITNFVLLGVSNGLRGSSHELLWCGTN